MKRMGLFFLMFGLFFNVGIFAADGDELLGFWYMPADSENRIPVAEIFKKDGKYYAYAFAFQGLEENTDRDEKNPDDLLRHVNMKELVFIYDLEFKKNKWRNGEIYNPENGRYFHLRGSLSNDKKVIIWSATIDSLGLLGKKIEWDRVDDPVRYFGYRPDMEVIYANIPTVRRK